MKSIKDIEVNVTDSVNVSLIILKHHKNFKELLYNRDYLTAPYGKMFFYDLNKKRKINSGLKTSTI